MFCYLDNNLSILPINNNFEKLTSEEETTKSFTELLVSTGTEQLSTTVQSYQEPSTSFDENTNKVIHVFLAGTELITDSLIV